MNLVDGEIICIDKPLGWTSFDAVKRVQGQSCAVSASRNSRWDMPAPSTLSPQAL